MPSATVEDALNEVPEARSVLWKLLISLVLVIVTAVVQFVQAVAPELSAALLHLLPNWLSNWVAPYLTTIVLGVAAALQKFAGKQHGEAVATALETVPGGKPPKELYKR